jgi:hypothetical protein
MPKKRVLLVDDSALIRKDGAADESISEVEASWSADSSQLGSQGLFSPRWSPDGRYLVANALDVDLPY